MSWGLCGHLFDLEMVKSGTTTYIMAKCRPTMSCCGKWWYTDSCQLQNALICVHVILLQTCVQVCNVHGLGEKQFIVTDLRFWTVITNKIC